MAVMACEPTPARPPGRNPALDAWAGTLANSGAGGSSQNRNVKVREIAELVIAGITGQPPQEPPCSMPG